MEKLISLMYHDSYVENKSESGFKLAGADVYKIRPQVFEHQLKLIDSYLEDNNLPKDTVHFTFDDGGVSFFTVFAPVLEKYGYKGYFFISTQFIGTDGFLSKEQIVELDRRGHIIGGHSDSHRQRMNDLGYDELLEDWKSCSNKLQEILGHPITCCSLPCGYISCSMMKALKFLGFTDIYTSEARDTIKKIKGMNVYGRYGIKESMSDEFVLSIVASTVVRTKIKIKKALLNIAKTVLGRTYVTIREKIFTRE